MDNVKLKVHNHEMKEVDEQLYLGDKITKCRNNIVNVKSRVCKSICIINNIFEMLKYLQNGHYYFRTAIILHESLLVNGVMKSSEAWHNLTSTDMNELMKIDKMFGQTLFFNTFFNTSY